MKTLLLTIGIFLLIGCSIGNPETSREYPENAIFLRFYGNGNTSGSVPYEDVYYIKGSFIQLVQYGTGTLEKTGYYFSHWNTKADGTGNAYYRFFHDGIKEPTGNGQCFPDNITMPDHDVDLYAIWCENNTKYTITYNTSSFSDASTAVDTNTYWPFDIIDEVKYSTRLGYSLLSWNTKEDGTGIIYRSTTPASGRVLNLNLILYPTWEIANGLIEYNTNQASSGTVPGIPTRYYYGDQVVVLGNLGNLERLGYDFVGWKNIVNNIEYSPGENFTFIWGGTTDLVPLWQERMTPQNSSLFGIFDLWTYTSTSGWIKVENNQLNVQSDSLVLGGSQIFPSSSPFEMQKLGIDNGQIWLTGVYNSEEVKVYLIDYILEDTSRYGVPILWLKIDTSELADLSSLPDRETMLQNQILCYIPNGLTPNP